MLKTKGELNKDNMGEKKRRFEDKERYSLSKIEERANELKGSKLAYGKIKEGFKDKENVLILQYPIYKDHMQHIYFDHIGQGEGGLEIYEKKYSFLHPW